MTDKLKSFCFGSGIGLCIISIGLLFYSYFVQAGAAFIIGVILIISNKNKSEQEEIGNSSPEEK